MGLTVVGLNHKKTPVEMRERLAVRPDALGGALSAVRTELGALETVMDKKTGCQFA